MQFNRVEWEDKSSLWMRHKRANSIAFSKMVLKPKGRRAAALRGGAIALSGALLHLPPVEEAFIVTEVVQTPGMK